MKIILAIGTGSFIGGILRYLLSQFLQAKVASSFPYGTLAVNIIGCFLIGVVFGFVDRGNLSNDWKLFLATGLLGGFTTFSAFSIETLALFREGQTLSAFAYIAASVLVGLLATFIGVSMTRF
jgi:CrcB protein